MLRAMIEPSRHLIIDHVIGRKEKRAQLEQFEFLESLIVRCDAQIEKAGAPFTESTELLQGPRYRGASDRGDCECTKRTVVPHRRHPTP